MRVILLLVVIFALINASLGGYSCPKPCYGNMCCSVAPGNLYYLTDFCGSQSACGPIPSCGDANYFTADAQRFGCGKYLNICTTSSKRCIKAQIIDSGPAMWVEQDAGRAIIDASPSACKYLFGANSCGWSDHFSITATIASLADSRPVGPFNVTDEEYAQLFVDHEIALLECEKEKSCNGADI